MPARGYPGTIPALSQHVPVFIIVLFSLVITINIIITMMIVIIIRLLVVIVIVYHSIVIIMPILACLSQTTLWRRAYAPLEFLQVCRAMFYPWRALACTGAGRAQTGLRTPACPCLTLG